MAKDRKREDSKKKKKNGKKREPWLTREPEDTSLGTGKAEEARKQLKNRKSRIEKELKKAGAK